MSEHSLKLHRKTADPEWEARKSQIEELIEQSKLAASENISAAYELQRYMPQHRWIRFLEVIATCLPALVAISFVVGKLFDLGPGERMGLAKFARLISGVQLFEDAASYWGSLTPFFPLFAMGLMGLAVLILLIINSKPRP